MLQCQTVYKYFSDRPVFNGINWHIRPQDRVGLCGENGAGKTTLLKTLAGLVEPDKGTVQMAKGTTMGYLPQDGLNHSGRSLFDEVHSALEELLAMQAELTALEGAMADNDEEALARYAQVQEAFHQRGGYAMESEVGKVLSGLGFAENEWQKPCEQFSGGWQMRIALAKLLLQRPNLLLLDEPTNHLDLPARNWLEDYLLNYPFAVVLVSHDRFFLDQVVTRIVEVWNGDLTEYPGNYSRYLEERDRRVEALRESKRRQDDEVERLEAFINRFRYQANKAAQVQSRVRQLEKIERIQLPPMRKKIAFTFPDPPKLGRFAVEVRQGSQAYGDLQVLQGVDLTVERGERLALVGPNGAGKSTLMRLLAGVEAPASGEREEGHNLHLAYFAQNQAEELTPERTVLEELMADAPIAMVPRLRDILGTFLFSGEDVEKKVRVLSGGERNRLALAKLLLRPTNLLLLDEPTNHLDLASKEVLLASLAKFKGTIVFVSHDRYFVDALAGRVAEVHRGRVETYLGNYEDFLRRKQADGDLSHQLQRVEVKEEALSASSDKKAGKQSYEDRKAERKRFKQWQKAVSDCESRVQTLELELAGLEQQMADPELYQDPDRWRECSQRHQAMKEELDRVYGEWEALHEDPPEEPE